MNRLGVFSEMVKHPREYAILWILLIVVLVSIYVILTAGADNWRHMYCTASEAQAIECAAKGWW